ncbi:MAG: zinc-ribbon domain-containing protein [Atopobiaceae bacterium]|nr:zinc-ribbon domain-containing protein [Atopobiaceae bacterium]
MDFFQDLTRAVDQATESAVRSGKSAQTKSHIAKLQRQREQLLAKLGAALYPMARENEKLRAGNEQLIESIERIDASIKQLEAQLLDLNTRAAPRPTQQGAPWPAQAATAQRTSPTREATPDSAQAAAAQEDAQAPRCSHCNAQLLPGASFCTNCGQHVIG